METNVNKNTVITFANNTRLRLTGYEKSKKTFLLAYSSTINLLYIADDKIEKQAVATTNDKVAMPLYVINI